MTMSPLPGPDVQPSPIRRAALFAAGLICLLLLTRYAYSLGLARGFEFDDRHNFVGLENVHDLASALVFIFSGDAGPLGRPISLLSFTLQAWAWPGNPTAMLATNIAIHLLNIGLVSWVMLRLGRDHLPRLQQPELFALGTATLWGLSPLLASASLLTVQRMTTLSATFVLLGTLAHLHLLRRLSDHPRTTSLALVLSMAAFTVLGSFAKESAAVLPLLLLTLHLTVLPLRYPALPKPYRYWPAFAFLPPALALIGYALIHSFDAQYALRGFTLNERLMTEARVVLDYLRLILLPMRAKLGPYHDDFTVSSGILSPASTLPSILAVLALSALALWKRRRWQMFSFAVLWFLVGHLLESTFVPLELYFEHRNYIPAIAPLAALAYALVTVPQPYARLARIGLAVYAGLFFVVLLQTTTVWADRRLSAELWANEHPWSERASQNLAQTLALQGEAGNGLKILRRLFEHQPDNIGLALQIAYVDSQLQKSGAPFDEFLRQHSDLLRTGRPNAMICQLLDESDKDPRSPLYGTAGQSRIVSLADALLANKRIQETQGAVTFCINRAAAQVAISKHDLPGTMRHLEAAFAAYPVLGIGLQLVAFPATAGLYEVARENLALVRQRIPQNPVMAKEWSSALDNAERALADDMREHSSPVAAAPGEPKP